MKYLLILISVFLMFGCYEEEQVTTNQLLVNQCDDNSDCIDNDFPLCVLTNDLDNKTERYECVPYNCFGWGGGATGDGNPIVSYSRDLQGNCSKHIIDEN